MFPSVPSLGQIEARAIALASHKGIFWPASSNGAETLQCYNMAFELTSYRMNEGLGGDFTRSPSDDR